MPLPSLGLSKAQLEDLAAVCGLGADKLSRVLDEIVKGKPTIKQSSIQDLASKAVDDVISVKLCRVLFSLATTARHYYMSSSQVVRSVDEALARTGWSNDQIELWNQCREIVIDLLNTKSVFATAKAMDLSFDFAQLFLSARILTGTRPVINQDRTDIAGSVITQTLRLDYSTPSGDQVSLTVAMDRDDIVRLQDACADALKKSDLTKKYIEEGWARESLIRGEAADE